MTHSRWWILGFVLCVWLGSAKAQTRGFELGGWLGGAWYFGDLNTNFDLSTPGGAGGLQMRYVFSPRISTSMRLSYVNIYDDDRWSDNAFERSRGLRFRTHIIDVTPQVEINFLPYKHGDPDYNFTPYVGLGVSVLRFLPTARYWEETGRLAISGDPIYEEHYFPNLRDIGTEGQLPGSDSPKPPYNLVTAGVAVTFGFKYNLNKDLTLQLFGTVRRLASDYLDDVSTTYPDAAALNVRGYNSGDREYVAIDPTGLRVEGNPTQRGNASDHDSYSTIGIGITYFFGQLRCPQIEF